MLNEVLDVSSLAKLPGYEDATPDTIQAILEEAAKLCENVLFPLNRTGDEEGCTYENGVVRTPKGFKEAYDQFREGGWTAVTCDPEYGGQGLPATVGFALQEMFTASNQAFSMYPGLSHGAYEALSRHGSDELKKTYLPKLTDGTWSGTMCLTEPHCGTDLGMLRTKAEPQADGSYSITGTKIFISAGEHDLAENILHLVLARLPDAPGGTKGISLFLVPKFLPKADGSVGERNGIRCGAIEHKMGIKANATCVMNLDGAKGWLVGELNKGMTRDVRDDERGPPRRRHAGPGHRRGLVPERASPMRSDRIQGRSLTGPKNADGPGRSDHRPSRRAAHAADPEVVHRGRPRAGAVGRHADRRGASPSRRGQARGGRRPGPDADADHQGVLHRHGQRVRQPRGADLRRPRLHPRERRRAARARRRASPSSTRAPTASRRSTWSAASCR